jgi:uncharacterized protein
VQFCISEVERMNEVHLSETISMPQIRNECGQIESIEDVSAKVDVTADAGVCHAVGNIVANIAYNCSRCLTTYSAKLTASLDESFTKYADKAEKGAHVVDGDVVDLNPFIEQELFLTVEYRPLCSKDCKGLCPECGCNRNEQACSCNTERIDPRLSILKDLHLEADSE